MTEPAVVDARGLRCPQPVIELARAARTTPAGGLVAVWWTDPAAEFDIPAWARMRGHVVVGTGPLDDVADERPDSPGPPGFVTTVRITG